MIYFIDIDNTICKTNDTNYLEAKPIKERIERINNLYDKGHKIIYWTARGTITKIDFYDETKEQLQSWGCKFHELRIQKPFFDVFVDDKAFNSNEFFK